MKAKPIPEIPAALAAALEKNGEAQKAFERMPPSHQREYIKWVCEAKKAETRARRAAKAVEGILEWGAEHPDKKGKA